jgi:hypothetical protein
VSASLHRRVYLAAATIVTVAAGLVWRLVPLGLPFFAYKYGGSMLWAMAVYEVLAFAFPRTKPLYVGYVAAGVAALVEFSRLIHPAALDAFRLTLAGKLLLGRFFSVRNIVAYGLAIAIAVLLDEGLARRRRTAGDEHGAEV